MIESYSFRVAVERDMRWGLASSVEEMGHIGYPSLEGAEASANISIILNHKTV
jgi:hypothetical protein